MADRIAELRKMVAEATQGPWAWSARQSVYGRLCGAAGNLIFDRDSYEGMWFATYDEKTDDANSRLIAQAPTLATDLAAALEREAKRGKRITKALEEIQQQLVVNEGYFSGNDKTTLQILQGHIKDQVQEIRAALGAQP